jgi:hypothetical protein
MYLEYNIRQVTYYDFFRYKQMYPWEPARGGGDKCGNKKNIRSQKLKLGEFLTVWALFVFQCRDTAIGRSRKNILKQRNVSL